MNSKMEFGRTYQMSDLKGKPTFWLYKVESFLYIKSYIVHCKRDGQHGIYTLRFRQIPYLEEVAKKYVDISKTEYNMTQEEKELLLSLLQKANEDSLIRVYDYDQNMYHADWIYLEDAIYIKIREV